MDGPRVPTLREAARVWARIGLLGFGGPAGQIALMHHELVETRRWIDEERFLHALNYCTLLPGPEAQQLATYVGWLMHRTRGGVVAGVLFVAPGFVLLLGLSALYAELHVVPAVAAVFFGLRAAVLAVVLEAVLRVGRRALRTPFLRGTAVAAFVALFFLRVPFPFVVLGAAAAGTLTHRVRPSALVPRSAPPPPPHPSLAAALAPAPAPAPAPATPTVLERLEAEGALDHTRPSLARAARTLAVCLVLWGLPIAAAYVVPGAPRVLADVGVLFSKAAVVTFGGAYAVLAYVGREAVDVRGWLEPGEMLDGLGLAETTPGPLVLVLEYVGFLGAYRAPGGLPPLAAGALGAAMTAWVTFVPSFLWIFLGGPWVEAVRKSPALAAALATVTAAVVGVIVDLSVGLGVRVLFRSVHEVSAGPVTLLVPDAASFDPLAAALALLAAVALFRFRLGLPRTLALVATIGVVVRLVARALAP